MRDLECPYCGEDIEVCHDDGFGYEEDQRHKYACSFCGRNFVFRTSISFFYEASKADCLNGSPHTMEMAKAYPPRWSEMRCRDCDFKRKPTNKEFTEAGITPEQLAER